jgi:hypothetical protein
LVEGAEPTPIRVHRCSCLPYNAAFCCRALQQVVASERSEQGHNP